MKQLLATIFAFSVLFFPALLHADEGWKIDVFSSSIDLQEDGKIRVDEWIQVDFGFEPKHGIYRDLPIQYTKPDGSTHYTEVTIKSVNLDRNPVEVKEINNSTNLRLQIGDPGHKVTGKHTYRIQYEVAGVLSSYENHDELYWNVTGNEWPVPIGQASASILLPQSTGGNISQASCYQGSQGSTEQCKYEIKANTAIFELTHSLASGEGMTIAAGYPKGLLPILTVTPPPSPYTTTFFSLLFGGFLLTNCIGAVLLFRQWWRSGRDGQDTTDSSRQNHPLKHTIVVEYESPAKLRPAEIGTLIDEKADTTDITATIVDLAVRGYLTITEEPKRWFKGADYTLTKKKAADKSLLGYEKTLLNRLFDNRDSIQTSKLQNTFYQDLADVKNEVYEEVTTKKLFISNPQTVRNTWIGVGVALLVLGIAGSFGFSPLIDTASLVAATLMGISGGLALTGFVTLICSFAMPARTAYGRELYRQVQGYELFINTAEKYRAQFAEKENLFTEVLPYAIVFGATKKLADAMKKIGITPSAPTWYYGPHPFNPVFFANSITSFDKSLATAMASSPSSSGSGGGGFSGGGFGGGGGGSW